MGMEVNNQLNGRAVNFKAGAMASTPLKPSFKANEADNFVSANPQEKEEGFIAQHWGKLLVGAAAIATAAYFIFKGKGEKAKEAVTKTANKVVGQPKDVTKTADKVVGTPEAVTKTADAVEKKTDKSAKQLPQNNQKFAPNSIHGDSSREHIKAVTNGIKDIMMKSKLTIMKWIGR